MVGPQVHPPWWMFIRCNVAVVMGSVVGRTVMVLVVFGVVNVATATMAAEVAAAAAHLWCPSITLAADWTPLSCGGGGHGGSGQWVLSGV